MVRKRAEKDRFAKESVQNTSGKSKSLISNFDDWFANCGVLGKKLQDYEGLMLKYYTMQCSNTDVGRQKIRDCMLEKHDCQFYKNNAVVPHWKMKRFTLIGLVAALIGIAIGMMLFVKVVQPNFAIDKDNKLIYTLVTLGLSGVIGFSAGLGIPMWIHGIRVKKLWSQMDVLEAEMLDRIKYVHPKYRNAQACIAFNELHDLQGVTGFYEAVCRCDAYLVPQNGEPLDGAIMAEMVDVPYANDELIGQDGLAQAETDASILDDPNLPQDITEKTFIGADNADSQLSELIGLDRVKAQIEQLKNRMNFNQSSIDHVSGNHMVFMGAAGTGKTTIARIIAKILYDYGYIQKNQCVEVDGGYLKAQYVGQTQERTNAIVKYALGGVLVVDNASILIDNQNGTAGAEAMTTLIKAMENHGKDLVVIMCGYEDQMNRLLTVYDGLNSRVKYKIYFDNFTVDELVQIFMRQMHYAGLSEGVRYRITKKAMEHIRRQLEKESAMTTFGNARAVRTMWESLMDIHADNYMTGVIPEEKKYIIVPADTDVFVENRKKQLREDNRNFIARQNLDSNVVSLQELQSKTKAGSENPDADLQALTGLSVVKDEIKQMKAQFDFYSGNMESEGYHMTFLGPPGTGKTTVAKIMTGYLYKMGIIQENSYVDINGDFLRGMYVGHTGKRTEAVVQYAQGMVLFVDEAYLLAGQPGDSNSFGQEAIGVLLDAMEKYRKNFVVIFAGYEDEMSVFLDMNSGLKSRISLNFHFQSYNPVELSQMMNRLAVKQKFRIEKNVWKPLQQWLGEQAKNPRFGNGRFVRQFWEQCKKCHIMAYSERKYDQTLKFVITLDDVQTAMVNMEASQF